MSSTVPRFLATRSSVCCHTVRTSHCLFNFRMYNGLAVINKAICSFQRRLKPALSLNRTGRCNVTLSSSGKFIEVIKHNSAFSQTDKTLSDLGSPYPKLQTRRVWIENNIMSKSGDSGFLLPSKGHFSSHCNKDRGIHFECTSPSVLALKTGLRMLSGPYSSTRLRMFTTDSTSDSGENSMDSGKDKTQLRKSKAEKSAVKEFKLKTSIGGHDLGIKLNQMGTLLDKGKTVHVILLSAKNSGESEATDFNKKISSELESLCKIHPAFRKEEKMSSGNKVGRFILTPMPKDEEKEKS